VAKRVFIEVHLIGAPERARREAGGKHRHFAHANVTALGDERGQESAIQAARRTFPAAQRPEDVGESDDAVDVDEEILDPDLRP
jgi:hypothetical protein